MKNPKVVVFDLGKVLLDFDYQLVAQRLQPLTGRPLPALRRMIDESPTLIEFECGRMTTGEFFAEVSRTTGFSGTLEHFSASFADIFTPIEPMVALHRELRRRQVPVFLFSNTNELAVNHIRASYPFFQEFDGHILSYEHGAMKPSASLYEVVETATQSRGADLLFLDDRSDNIAAALARGWRAFVHKDPDQSRAILAQHGFLNGQAR